MCAARCTCNEFVRCPVGGARAFLDVLAETGRPAVEELGLRCVGVFRAVMGTDTEAIVIWAIPDLATWAVDERGVDRGRAWLCRRTGWSCSAPTCSER